MKRVSVYIVLLLALVGCDSKPTIENPQQVAATVVVAPPESKDDYIKSTYKIGRKSDKIFYKDFLKNPDIFDGKRVNITGKILNIDETGEGAVIQLVVTEKYDSVMIFYPRKTKFYDDDWITIYGECKGSYEGKTAMGTSMRWPLIKAEYLKKRTE